MPKEKKVVKNFPHPRHLSEDYQNTGFFFSFVTSPKIGLQQCHEWAKCRDFLPDAVKVQLTERDFGIHGFTFSTKKNPPVDLTKMRMLVSKEGLNSKNIPDFKDKIRHSVKLLNHFERVAGVPLTKVEEVVLKVPEKYHVIFMFTSPKMWMTSPILISMYSFLIRLGDKKIEFKGESDLKEQLKELTKDSGDRDCRYLKSSWDKMHTIVKNRKVLFPKKRGYHDAFFKSIESSDFHHRLGLRALCDQNSSDRELNERMKEILAGGQK